MKKIIALALTVVMVLGLMAGCQKPMDAATLAQKMDEAAKGITAMAGSMGMELDLSMGMTGMTIDMGMDLDAEMNCRMDMSAGYIKVQMDVEAMGESEVTEMETYITTEDGKIVTYTYEDTMGMWMKTEQDDEMVHSLQEDMLGLEIKFSDIAEEDLLLAEEQETVDGKSCYVLTMELDGAYFERVMSAFMTALGGEMEEVDLSILEDLDLDPICVKMVYHVDAATFLPVQYKAEVSGLDQVFGGIFGEFMGAEGLQISIPTFTLYMKELTYNGTDVPAVPQEAIDNAVTEDELMEDWEDDLMEDWEEEPELGNPPQADGSFLMQLGETSVRITVPERYVVLMSEVDFLDAMTEDYAESVICMMVREYTHDDMLADFQYQVQMAKEEERWLSDEITQDANGFTVGSIIYNDGVYEVTGWKEIEGNVVAVSASSFEYLPQIGEILGNIVIGE